MVQSPKRREMILASGAAAAMLGGCTGLTQERGSEDDQELDAEDDSGQDEEDGEDEDTGEDDDRVPPDAFEFAYENCHTVTIDVADEYEDGGDWEVWEVTTSFYLEGDGYDTMVLEPGDTPPVTIDANERVDGAVTDVHIRHTMLAIDDPDDFQTTGESHPDSDECSDQIEQQWEEYQDRGGDGDSEDEGDNEDDGDEGDEEDSDDDQAAETDAGDQGDDADAGDQGDDADGDGDSTSQETEENSDVDTHGCY